MSYRGSNWNCPRCGSPLGARRDPFDGSAACASCGGAFVSHGYLQTASTEIAAKVSTRMSSVPVDDLKCPVCRDGMRRSIVETSRADVQIDYCLLHGFWFDAREFVALQGPSDDPPT